MILKRKLEFNLYFHLVTVKIYYTKQILYFRTTVVHAIEDEPFNVSCQFKANPIDEVHIKWYKNGHILGMALYMSKVTIFGHKHL